jgi:hypothetical protein
MEEAWGSDIEWIGRQCEHTSDDIGEIVGCGERYDDFLTRIVARDEATSVVELQ